jgi:hypothetical protein
MQVSLLALLLAVAVQGFQPIAPQGRLALHNTRTARWATAEEKTEAMSTSPSDDNEDDDDEVPLETVESLGRGAAKVSEQRIILCE